LEHRPAAGRAAVLSARAGSPVIVTIRALRHCGVKPGAVVGVSRKAVQRG
jgi:hypothetical protein